jgi:hypothetical protein
MNKITELRPQFGGGDGGSGLDCLIIEKVDNGYVLRALCGGDETIMECRVYSDRAELLKDVAARL